MVVRAWIGIVLLALGVCGLVALTAVPVAFLLIRPGGGEAIQSRRR